MSTTARIVRPGASLTTAQVTAGGVAPVALNGSGVALSAAGTALALPTRTERAQLALENSTLLALGNSYDEGTGAGVTANGMHALTATRRGWTLTNIAVGGATLDSYARTQFGSRAIAAGDNIAGTFGLNDLRYWGPLPVRREQYLHNFLASASYLCVPDANKVHGNAGTGANWSSANPEFGGAGTKAVVTTTNGATRTFSVTGDTVIVWFGQNTAAGRITIEIDGATYASGSISCVPRADSPVSAGQWMLGCAIRGGLSSGAHTVVVRTQSTSPVVILACAGFTAGVTVGANLYAIGLPNLKPAHWNIAPGANGSAKALEDNKPIDFYQLQAVREWNAGMRDTIADIRALGLNARYVDVSSISFESISDGDLHPEPPQHDAYSRAVLAAMAEARAQQTAAAQPTNVAQYSAGQVTAGAVAPAALTSGNVLLDASGATVLTKSGTDTTFPGAVSVTGGTVATNKPALDVGQTWNGAGQPFDGLKVSITNTASGTNAFPLNVYVGGVSIFSLRKDGYITLGGAVAGAVFGQCGIGDAGPGIYRSYRNTGGYFAGAAADVSLVRGGAGIWEQRNGTAAQTFRTFGTYTDASNGRWLNITMSTAGVAAITPTGNGTGATGNVLHISGLPTSNPGPGILWNDAGTVKVGT